MRLINHLYKTIIECSDYNPSIDNQITITVKLVDFNDNIVTGESVTISCDKGTFSNNLKTYTASTTTNGYITVIYNCSEWGLVTFSANNASVSVRVTGFKSSTILTRGNSDYIFYVDECLRHCMLVCNIKKDDYASVYPLPLATTKTVQSNLVFDTKYNPIGWYHVRTSCYRSDITWGLYIDSNDSNNHYINARSDNVNATPVDLTIIFRWTY